MLWRPRTFERWGSYWRAALALVAASALVLLAFATANATFGERFGLGASPGWYLYARAAQFADCSRFTPPAGTQALCEDRPTGRAARPSLLHHQPERARAQLRPLRPHDDLLGTIGQAAILAQPGDYLDNVRHAFAATGFRARGPTDLTPAGSSIRSCAFTNGFSDSGDYSPSQVPTIELAFERSLETYYNRFSVHQHQPGLEFLREVATRGAVRRDGTVDRHDSHLARARRRDTPLRAWGCCCSASGAWC